MSIPGRKNRAARGAALLFAAILAGCDSTQEASEAIEAPEAPEVPAVRAAPLPDGAQAISLLGEPLYPPEQSDAVREVHETNYAAAMADLEAAPEAADALIWAGRRAAYLARYREAIATFTRGMELHPADARFLRHRGHRYVTVREIDAAIRDFRTAVELIRGTEDQVEPDGLPNARNIPTSTLHFNVWYHLGLAHYLKGELRQALAAWEECLAASKHPDSVVATSYWLVNTALRLGLETRAADVLAGIHADADIIESTAYLDLLLLHKGERLPEEVGGGIGAGSEALESATTAYGVGNWHFVNGRTEEAEEVWRGVLERSDQWASFGFIAAEAEIARGAG